MAAEVQFVRRMLRISMDREDKYLGAWEVVTEVEVRCTLMYNKCLEQFTTLGSRFLISRQV